MDVDRVIEDGEVDGEVEGEDLQVSGSKPTRLVISDTEEEDSDEEMDEHDKQFIVDDLNPDGLVEDAESREERRMLKKRRRKEKQEGAGGDINGEDENADEFSDDEMQLINENYSKANRKRLRNKADVERDTLEHIFDNDSEQDDNIQNNLRPSNQKELYEDDLDDFIIRDDSDSAAGSDDGMREEKNRIRKKERINFQKNLSGGTLDEAIWIKIQTLFGDGSDYQYAMFVDAEEVLENDDSGEDIIVVPKKSKEIQLKDIYEPAEIAQKMLTEKDDNIRIVDLPERLQGRERPMMVTSSDLAKEAGFIARSIPNSFKSQEKDLIKCVVAILRFLKLENVEVPFIIANRRDYFENILLVEDIWKIYDLDESYMLVEAKKSSLENLILRIEELGQPVPDSMLDCVGRVCNLDSANDAANHFQIHFSAEFEKLQKDVPGKQKTKKPFWKATYDDALANKFEDLTKLFGMDMQGIVEDILGNSPSSHRPVDPNMAPIEIADKFLCSKFQKAEGVLEGARLIIAHQIASIPRLRSHVRGIFQRDALVTVTPTERGKSEISASHPFYPFKYLTNKPVYLFALNNDMDILQIFEAESSGLVAVSVFLSNEKILVDDFVSHFTSANSDNIGKQWNLEREKIALHVTRKILFPHAVKWFKEQWALLKRDSLALACQIDFEKLVNIGPIRLDESHQKEDIESEGSVVLALSCGNGERGSPSFATVVDPNGVLTDWVKFDHLFDKDLAGDDHKLCELIKNNNPAAILVGGFKPNTKTQFLKTIETIVSQNTNVNVFRPFIVDDTFARAYMHTKTAIAQFPEKEFPFLVRYCVGLSRGTQDTTIAFASLFNMDQDYEGIKVHPLQHLLPADKLKVAFERGMINVVGNTGVDIMSAAMYPHLSHTLQFVSGLGPRKARAMLNKITRNGGKLETRSDMIRKTYCGPKIWMNCASFIRIHAFHFRESYVDTALDVLDGTRVHPEDYELARKMASDAMDAVDADPDADENPSYYVQELMESDTSRLDQLMLDDYAIELERQIHEPKRICLSKIKEEIIEPYRERRKAFHAADPGRIFEMLTGETSESLKVGTFVSATVIKVKERLIVCQTSSGLEGVIRMDNLDVPSDQASSQLERYYPVHTALKCAVLSVNEEKLNVELSVLQEDVKAAIRSLDMVGDKYFDQKREDEDLYEIKEKRKVQPRATRNIPHRFFVDCTFKTAEKLLADKPLTDIIVRASSRSTKHFSFTWRIGESIYQHLDVLELNKDNEFTIGKKLMIDELEFTEIDEIIETYINPIIRKLQDIRKHEKFQRMSLEIMAAHVTKQSDVLRRSAYGFILSSDKPGSLYLVYKHPINSERHELIVVKPKGYFFRMKLFPTLDELIGFFKHSEAKKASKDKEKRPPPPPMPLNRPPPPGNYQQQESYGVHPERTQRMDPRGMAQPRSRGY